MFEALDGIQVPRVPPCRVGLGLGDFKYFEKLATQHLNEATRAELPDIKTEKWAIFKTSIQQIDPDPLTETDESVFNGLMWAYIHCTV